MRLRSHLLWPMKNPLEHVKSETTTLNFQWILVMYCEINGSIILDFVKFFLHNLFIFHIYFPPLGPNCTSWAHLPNLKHNKSSWIWRSKNASIHKNSRGPVIELKKRRVRWITVSKRPYEREKVKVIAFKIHHF